MGLCSNNCPTHKGRVYLFPHTLKTETKKKTIKIKSPNKNIEKAKRGGKKNQQEKKEINKILKKYRKKKRSQKIY